MALYKRSTTWWVSFTSPSGERIRSSARTEVKKQAQEYHDRLKAELWRKHQLGEKPRRTWQDAAVRWHREKEHKADIGKDVAKLKWFRPYLGGRYLDEIDRDLVDRLAKAKRDEASPATANRYLVLLRSMLRAARDDWEWIENVPKVQLFSEPRKRVRWLTQEEATRLLKELPSHLADMAAFMLATGLRQSNVSFLRWDQVDTVRGMAWVHPVESKSLKAIAVPLNEDVLAVLQKRQGAHRGYVFTYKDKPVARTTTKAWAAGLQRAGISDFRWNDLRHTWAFWHVRRRTRLQELQELGGRSSYDVVFGMRTLRRTTLKGRRVASKAQSRHNRRTKTAYV